MCICDGGGVCAYSGVEVDGNLSDAFRLYFGKFNAKKFLYVGLRGVSSSLQLKKQLCHKMSPRKTNCFNSLNLTVTV